jgi:hypothetical protein
VSQDVFRRRLAALVGEFLERGGDAHWVNSELSLTGMALLDTVRCDLADDDDDPFCDSRGRNPEKSAG